MKKANTRGTTGATGVVVVLEAVANMAVDITDDRALGAILRRCMSETGPDSGTRQCLLNVRTSPSGPPHVITAVSDVPPWWPLRLMANSNLRWFGRRDACILALFKRWAAILSR
jgi:hypothetical protein